jgi:2-polyprenyl-3-methyl-5-hydroxy-6-metoxy-1,4-benzoquinol methylase
VGQRRPRLNPAVATTMITTVKTSMASQFNAAGTAAEFLAVWLNHPVLSDPNQKILDHYYSNFRKLDSPRMRYWYNQQLIEAEALVRATPGLRVLEIGVGTGSEALWWAMLGADVTGIDVFRNCIDVATERLDVLQRATGRKLKCSLQTVQITQFEDESGFDLIWLEQAFHHLEPRDEVVRRIAKLLRPGGHVVFSEANAFNPLLQLQGLLMRGLKTRVTVETELGNVSWGHERILSRGALKRLLRRVGIVQVSSRYYRLFPSWPVFESMFALERRMSSFWLPPVFTHYNLVGRKGT